MSQEVKKDSYRALLHLRANGVEVSDYELNVWRREEDLVRAAMACPRFYQNCGVEPAHFAAPVHSIAWQAIMGFVEADPALEEVDGAALLCEMRTLDANDERLGGARGNAWLAAVISEMPVSPEYALQTLVPEVLRRHRLGLWVGASDKVRGRVGVDRDLISVEADFVSVCSDIVTQVEGEGRVSGPMDSIDWDPQESAITCLVPTGNRFIDRYAAGGHGLGELLVWGGGTNHGKSYAAERLLADQARLEQPALYIGCEDSWELMYCRMLADYSEGTLSPAEIRMRKADPKDVVAAQERMRAAHQGRIFIVEIKKPTIDQVCWEVRKYARVHGVKMVILDYLQAVTATDSVGNKTQEMSEVTSKFKRTLSDTQVAGVAFSQYAREQYRDGTEPNINACKYCGDIENEAEIMVMFWKDAEDVLRAKIPKMKWAKASKGGLRYVVPVNPVTGCHEQWQEDYAE